MKKSMDRYEFIFEMDGYYRNAFSFEGLNCLYDYLLELEEEFGEELEFDPVALHSQYSEMSVDEFVIGYYDNGDVQDILNTYRLNSIEEITANALYEYECLYLFARIISVVDESTVLVDTER